MIILIILLSPFILRKRYQKTNKNIKFEILFVFFYPLILPIHFFENINGKFGFVVNAFTIIGSSIRYEHWCIEMVYIFHISIVLPFVFYFSSISYHRRSKIIKYINFSIIIMIFVIFFYHHMFFMAQSISIVYLILTSGNVICLIFLIITIILFREKERFSSPNQNIQIIN
jgi:hypothetical protein